jgi:proteasome lid subunit RPN8/RPN11
LKVPQVVFEQFAELAQVSGENETIGFLLGAQSAGGEITVSHLCVPKQDGSANGCEADADSVVFITNVFAEQEGLKVFGWIHVSSLRR